MMAIIGMSGSGKTTLLQILGGRNTKEVSGSVFIQGIQFSKVMRSHISYIWQDDLFFPSAQYTVRDQLMFTAYVQMHHSTPHQDILNAVQKVLEQLHIQHCADRSLQVISGGERRRTSIAMELLSDPRVLLIDEGTSGLDSAAAFDLLSKLKVLAVDNQIPVLIIIHQPSTRAFYLFDTVLVLSGGCAVYRGPPSQCMAYLATTGVTMPSCQQNYNPADFLIDLLYCEEVDPATGAWPRYTLTAAWAERERLLLQSGGTSHPISSRRNTMTSDEEAGVEMKSTVSDIELGGVEGDGRSNPPPARSRVSSRTPRSRSSSNSRSHSRTTNTAGTKAGTGAGAGAEPFEEYKSSYSRQMYAVFLRSFKAGYVVQFGVVNELQTCFMAVLVGLCWFQVPLTESRVQDFAGYIFFAIAYWFFEGMFDGMLEFLPERPVIRRELISGDYRLSAYFLAKTLAGIPVKVVLPWLFVTISYFLVAAQPSAEVYFSFAGIVVLSTLCGNSIGLFIGTLTQDYHIATSLTTVVALGMLIVGGFYLKELPHWLQFLGNLSAFRFAYRASVQISFSYIDRVQCEGGFYIYACFLSTTGTISGSEVAQITLGANVDAVGINVVVLLLFFLCLRLFAYWSLLASEFSTLFRKI